MTRRLTLHLLAGMLSLAVVLAVAIGLRSYLRRQADYQSLGSQNALLGAQITQFALEKAVDNGLFDREAFFRGRYELIDGRGAVRYRTDYDHFFDRNVGKILKAFQANDDVYYAYVINNDGFIPAHTDEGKSKTKIDRSDAGPSATNPRGMPCDLLVKNEDGFTFREFRARFSWAGSRGENFASAFPLPSPTTAAAKWRRARSSSRCSSPWWLSA